jgi:hypothetical protein
MEEAVEIAKLRLFLTLVASAHSVDQLEPLPNIDFNLLAGNSLIGLMRVDEAKFGQGSFTFGKPYRQLVEEKDRAVSAYRDAATYSDDLRQQRDGIDRQRADANDKLNELLLDEFQSLGIKYGEATWDHSKQREGKGKKRTLTVDDINALHPFHWGYEFDEIVNKRKGFDAIITNPPWEAVVGSAKEFFSDYAPGVSKNALDIKDFEKTLALLLKDRGLANSWLSYLSSYNHLRSYFLAAPDYRNQVATVAEKRQRTDLNLYKLFLERCFHLLKPTGDCGIVLPGSIYADVGAKQLRRLLFDQSEITGLFGFENRKQIFENVDSRFKFVVLTFVKGGNTKQFPTAFMRHHVSELESFPTSNSHSIPVAAIERLSPDSLSVMELSSALDLTIVEKMLRSPFLHAGTDTSSLQFKREFHLTDDAYLFRKLPEEGSLPLYEGKMIHQYNAHFAEARYWVLEADGRKALINSRPNPSVNLPYERFRLTFRDVARNTDERTMIAALLPRGVFAGHTLYLNDSPNESLLLYLMTIFNSVTFDWFMRLKVSAHVNPSYVYQSPVPQPGEIGPAYEQLIVRAARLVRPVEEFSGLVDSMGLAAMDPQMSDEQRAGLRAEIDAIVAHLYGINDEELKHILATFPIVSEQTKRLILETFRNWKPASDDPLMRMISRGEHLRLEFKETARWDVRREQINKELEHVIVRTVAAFMNSEGGTLLIGVTDSGATPGLARDYRTLGKKQGADAYENWLTTRLLESMGKDRTRLLKISFLRIEGNEICRVDVERSTRPVFVHDPQGHERLYVRAGNSTRELSVSEALDYCHDHFVRGAAQSAVAGPSAAATGTANENQRPLEIGPPKRRTASFPTHGLFSGTAAASPQAAAGAGASKESANESTEEDDVDTPKRRFVDQYDVEDVLPQVRDVVSGSDPLPRDEAVHEIATRLGAERVGSRVRELIESALNTASRRLIIETVAGGLVPRHRTIDDYERDFLKTALKNVIGRTWTDEDEAIRAATRWLGFRRTGHKIEQAFKSAIRGALQQGLLERDRHSLRVC